MKKGISLIIFNDSVLKKHISDVKNTQYRSVEKEHIKIVKQYEKEKKKRNIFNNRAENKYSFITKVDAGDGDDYKCFALNGNYKRCKNNVTYLHNGIKNKQKICNVSLCTRHTNLILNSKNKKNLKFGFYFESDKYT